MSDTAAQTPAAQKNAAGQTNSASGTSDVIMPAFPVETSVPWGEMKKDGNGLVPCIVQDAENGDVLMMAWMNEESYKKTLESGLMTYWSRSRQELWTKGMTSGHFQHVITMSVDCDKDTLLAKVEQTGAACHTGHRSCFFTKLF